MNLVIPIASNSKFFNLEDYGYPKPLIEISGLPIIEHVIKNITRDNSFKKIIFILNQAECDEFHLDSTLNLLSPIAPEIIKLQSNTQGALCSVLFAIQHINNNDPLLISNADQIFDQGIADHVERFIISDLDAACLTFTSVHPRWSYVKINDAGLVIQAAEKRPISKHAIAGVYMYKKGSDFIKNGMSSIKHGAGLEGQYFISPVFNEYILAGKRVGYYPIPNEQYHTFYSPQKIEEYKSGLTFKKGRRDESI
jgi:dTDP-glucose pyrophosphorylase